jgi:RNA polymerase sigma factor (sigma-70 family)
VSTPLPGDLPQLVERLKQGDAAAEALFYERFGARVSYLARRELRSSIEADDVRSETLMRAISAIRDGKLRAADALPSFVLQTARNVIHERMRQTRRFVPLAEPGDAREPASPAVEPPDPMAAAALTTALSQLNARDRAFMKMHYYDDLPRDVIARRLGVDEARVRLVKSRALQRFREAYLRVTAR